MHRSHFPLSAALFASCRFKRVYTTGLEHDPTFGPEAVRKRMFERGVKLPGGGAGRAVKNAFANQQAGRPTAHPTAADRPLDQKRPDSRFYRKVSDFREMKDDDPYRDLFGERRSFVRSKVGAWRSQFERENEDVELPYERTNPLSKTAPNWFVKWMVGIRENQGLDPWYLFASFGVAIIFLMLWNSATMLPMGRERDVTDMK